MAKKEQGITDKINAIRKGFNKYVLSKDIDIYLGSFPSDLKISKLPDDLNVDDLTFELQREIYRPKNFDKKAV